MLRGFLNCLFECLFFYELCTLNATIAVIIPYYIYSRAEGLDIKLGLKCIGPCNYLLQEFSFRAV